MIAKTYTIATANDMLIAIVPDGQDIAAEVERRDDVAEQLQRMRRSDAELDAYFGGRAKYLQQLREDLEAARARLAGGFAADDERTDPVFGLLGAEDPVLWQRQREGVIRQLELTLAANI